MWESASDILILFTTTQVLNFYRMNNEDDPVPTLPPRLLGFQQPDGEVHIISADNVVFCSGADDATDAPCTDSQVPTILSGDLANHNGPYEGIYIGTDYCTST